MKENVQSIERAFDILNVIHQRQQGIGMSSLASEAGLHLSTTSRIVSTLEHLGAISRTEGKLYIGEAILKLAAHAPWKEQLISVATPFMRHLAAETEEAVGLTTIEGDECVVFYQIPSSHHIQIRDWTGERFPLHVTSSGKLYLAVDNIEKSEDFAYSLTPKASKTITDPRALLAELQQIKREGVAWTIDELEDGLTSVAAAIQSNGSQPFVGLYVSLPSFRFDVEQDKESLGEQVLATAVAIQNALGLSYS